MSKSVEQIHDEILEHISDEYQKTIGYPTYDITRAMAYAVADLLEITDNAVAEIDVENMTGEVLRKFVKQRRNIVWNDAVKAVCVLTATTSGSATVPEGTLFESQGGVQFRSTEEATINGVTGNIPVEAVIGGAQGNVVAGSITLIPTTITGLVSVTNETAAIGGYRAETDDELRARYLNDLKNPVASGNKAQYREWALEVSGVGAVKVFPLAYGDNTVEVCIIGNDGLPAAPTLIASVQNHIDPASSGTGEGTAPIGAYCTVTTAESVDVNITADVTLLSGYDAETVNNSIRTRLSTYLASIAFNTTYVSYAHLADTIHDTEGVADYANLTINGGTASINIGDKQVAVLGTVIIND